LAETPEQYEWSSYNCYIGLKRVPSWLHRDFILGDFGDKVSSAQLGYQEFVSWLVTRKYDSPLKEVTASVLPGSQDFIQFIKGTGQDPAAARNIKLYLCRKHTGERLRPIGARFGIGDAAVAQACKRFQRKLEKDRKLRAKMERFEKRFSKEGMKARLSASS
jgi:hypothetical protein